MAPLAERLAEIKVLWRRPDMLCLYGLPYVLRPGQSARDLWNARERYVPPAPGHYGAANITLDSWLWLGSPGWWGPLTKDEQAQIAAFLASKAGQIPDFPGEWCLLE